MTTCKSYKLILSCLVWLCLFSLTACSEEKVQAEQKLPPPKVTAVKVESQTLPIIGQYMGQALGFLTVEVRAQIPGILLKKFYKEGDFVNQGQLLFEIDDSQAKAALNQAKAFQSQAQSSYDNAKREWDRILPLYNQNAVSQRDRDQAQANFLAAQANLAAASAATQDAEIKLGYTKVIAPISGYTSLEARNEGNLITLDSQGSLLTIINQTDPMYISFSLPGSEITRLARLEREGKAKSARTGANAEFIMMDGYTYPEKGLVTFIDTQIDPLTNTLQARAEFPNPKGGLIPNMFGKIRVSGTYINNVIVLPQKAILQTAQGPMVYVVNAENIVDLKSIKLGDTFEDLFIIAAGLVENDVVVTEGINKIHPGLTVEPLVTTFTRSNELEGSGLLQPNDLNVPIPVTESSSAI